MKEQCNNKKKGDNEKCLQRSNSFSKEFISINENDGKPKDDYFIHQSSRNLNNLSKMEEQILGKPKELSTTVLYEKIKKKNSSKGLKTPILALISGHKELKNIANSLNINGDHNINIDDYLQVRNIPKITNENFERLRDEISRSENLDSIYKDIMNFPTLPFNEINYHDNVGCLLPLEALIESKYNGDPLAIEEMSYKYDLYKKYVYNYRFIKGDGNCFYRAIIFRYFEIIILNNKIDLLKNIIYDMKESFKSNEISSRIRIKFDTILETNLVLQIMIIILELLEDKRISDAHYLYIKSMNIYSSFDYGLILYFRYIFYKYIKKNENKLYLESFPIKIGNLLPSKYETNKGEFLFNKFYYCYLLSMFTEAEKIIIYLTPFVLGINLDIIVYDDNENEVIKNISYTGSNEYNFNKDKLFVLNINGHYELLYNENDNCKYREIFKKYINNYLKKEDNKQLSKSVNINKKINANRLIDKKCEEKSSTKNNSIYQNSSPTKKNNNFNIKTTNTTSQNINNKSKTPYNSQTSKVNHKFERNEINLDDENSPKKENKNFLYKYSNISKKNQPKSYINDKNEIKITNNNKNNNPKLISQFHNENFSNNNRYFINNNGEEYFNENINENIEEKQKIKESIDIKRMNLILKKNNQNGNDNNSIAKSQHINNKNIIKSNNLAPSNKVPQKKNEIKMEDSKSNNYKCKICSLQYNLKFENEKVKNICYACLKNEIINQIYPCYLSYIENIMNNISFELAFKNYFNIFLKNEINLNELNISIENSIKELYNKNNDNIIKNESQEMKSLFREIKNFCIMCLKEVSNQKYQIPCGCNFCSLDHIKKYFHLKNKIKDITNYVCICSYEYSNIDIYNLGLFFDKNKLFSLKNDTINLLNIFLSKQCCFCCVSIDYDNRTRIKYKDLDEDIRNNLILGDRTKLMHHLCNVCNLEYNKNQIFFCNICNRNHIYYPY